MSDADFKACIEACYACAAAFHHAFDIGEANGGRVSRRRHRERSMRGTAVDRPFGRLACQESVDQTRSKRIAAAYTIENIQVLA